MLDGTTRLTCKGKSIKQLARLGTFSEYIVVPEMLVVKVSGTKPCEYRPVSKNIMAVQDNSRQVEAFSALSHRLYL